MDAAERRILLNDWLKDFSLAIKNVSLYSAEHPRGREYLDRAYDSLRLVLGERREIVLARSHDRLTLDGVLLDRDPVLAEQLAEDLEARGVESLSVHSTLTPEEHFGLIRGLMTKPDRVIEKGDFSQILIDEGVASVKASAQRAGRAREASAEDQRSESALIELLGRQARWPGGDSATSILDRDPVELARAVETMARQRNASASPEMLAEALADTLERLAERAVEEHERNREDILQCVGLAAASADPSMHATLFLEKAGSRSIRKLLAAAVETLPPDAIARVVAAHYPRVGGDFRRLSEILGRINTWRDRRAETIAAIEKVMEAQGLNAEGRRELVDHLVWSEVALERRLELLYKGDLLFQVDFTRLKEVLVRLLATGMTAQAGTLIQRYLDGLTSGEPDVRRRVADNARYILQLFEKGGRRLPLLDRLAELFFTRYQEEQDPEVVARLAGVLAFLVDLRLRSGALTSALELMRRAEQLSSSPVPPLRDRGERLAESLSRAGNEKLFKSLTEMLLDGNDQSSFEAAEILKRGGHRSAGYLIERLAEEENRSHRARLVMLLKDMGKGSSSRFVSRLDDPRWFLVRNVVGILGDIGDAGVIPMLKRVASHGDPRVRREVVRTLARFGTPECEEMVIAAVGDEDRGVQITAVKELVALKGPRSLGVLIDVARRSSAFPNVSNEVRQEAVAGLGRLGRSEALPALKDILERRGFIGHSEPTELRVAAARALGGLSLPEAKTVLRGLVTNDPRQPVRDAAEEALKQRGAPPAADAVSQPR